MRKFPLVLACVLTCLFSTLTFAQADSQAVTGTSSDSRTEAPSSPGATVPSEVAVKWVKDHRDGAMVFAAVALLIVLVTAALLIASGRSPTTRIGALSASFFFWLGTGYLLLLLLVAVFYVQLYPAGTPPYLLGGVLPVGVPWFGAVGAVVISLEGIFAYGQRGWDPKYNYWHIGRPLFGAVLGVVAFFTYVLIVMSSGSPPKFLDHIDGKVPSLAAKDYIIYYVVAFLVGYREETFRELIKRVTDLILKPATVSTEAPAVTFKQGGVVVTNWDFGTVAAGAPATVTIEIASTGKGTLKSPSVAFENTSAGEEFSTANDQLSGLAELKPGESKSVDIKFSPAADTTSAGVLTVTGSNLSAPAKLQVSGKASSP